MSQPEYSPDPPEGAVIIDTPTHWIGLCDECRQVKQFTTERARDLWQRNHPHSEDS